MNKMIFLLDKIKIINLYLLQIKLKFDIYKNLYFAGIFGILKTFITLNLKKKLNIFFFKQKFDNYSFDLNSGHIGILHLNGLGFKCTKKIFNINKRYWRFNVGHSQTFRYYTPWKVIMKVKQRFIFFFGLKRDQIFDIMHKIKSFHIPDSYKGVGIKYPDEVIILKKGKVRQ